MERLCRMIAYFRLTCENDATYTRRWCKKITAIKQPWAIRRARFHSDIVALRGNTSTESETRSESKRAACHDSCYSQRRPWHRRGQQEIPPLAYLKAEPNNVFFVLEGLNIYDLWEEEANPTRQVIYSSSRDMLLLAPSILLSCRGICATHTVHGEQHAEAVYK